MIEPKSQVSVRRQCELLRVSRSGLYYEPAGESAEDLAVMRRIDEIHLERPFYGTRRVTQELRVECGINRKRVQRLMRLMGLEAIAPKPKTSRKGPEHPIFPYLLRNLEISRANQVWAADLTYVPLARGFVYLVAVMDWCSRRVVAWRLSNTMETSFCVEALREALDRFGKPEIFNTDQGAQFTAEDFVAVLRRAEVRISMDGKGRFLDNVFVERLWRSLQYGEGYLHAYESPAEARAGIGRYLDFYNSERPHQSLGYQTPAAFYCANLRASQKPTPTHASEQGTDRFLNSPQTPLVPRTTRHRSMSQAVLTVQP